MKYYKVTWEVDIEAESAEAAAVEALSMHRDEESIATVFEVSDMEGTKKIDLDAVCSSCGFPCASNTAHLHQGEYIGECCWDERLKITE